MSRTPDAEGWVSLSDAQWTNIVNHDRAFEGMSKDDAVHLAVKMTEAKLRELNVDAKATAKLRDEFAASVLSAHAMYHENGYSMQKADHREFLAKDCYAMADAMLAARSSL